MENSDPFVANLRLLITQLQLNLACLAQLFYSTQISYSPTADTMPKEPELSINEKSFILEALKQNIRLDGRALDAFRDVELTFGEEYGLVDVRLGKTRFVSFFLWSLLATYPATYQRRRR